MCVCCQTVLGPRCGALVTHFLPMQDFCTAPRSTAHHTRSNPAPPRAKHDGLGDRCARRGVAGDCTLHGEHGSCATHCLLRRGRSPLLCDAAGAHDAAAQPVPCAGRRCRRLAILPSTETARLGQACHGSHAIEHQLPTAQRDDPCSLARCAGNAVVACGDGRSGRRGWKWRIDRHWSCRAARGAV